MKSPPVATPAPTAAAAARVAPPVPTAVPAPAPERIARSLAGGSPLPPSLRARMEAGFGTSFAGVRIHTGAAAAGATEALGAEALASGADLAFAPGRYRPGTEAGDRLIAHELAHVVQQRGGGGEVQAKGSVSSPGEAAEAEADRAAEAVLAGRRAEVAPAGAVLRGRLLRRARMGAPGAPSPALTPAPALAEGMTPGSEPAGGEVTAEAAPKRPDEAQTAQPATLQARSPPDVMRAGTPAGGAPAEAKSRRTERREAEAGTGTAPAAQPEAPRQARAPAGSGFGRNLGERGAAAAAAARARLAARAAASALHEGAGARIRAAQAAAEPAPTAAAADGQRRQAAALATAELPVPDAAAASARARGALQAAAPTTIAELDAFAGPAGARSREAIAGAIGAEAAAQAAPVSATLSTVRHPAPGQAPPPAVPQPDPLAAPATAAPDLAEAAPPPVPEASLDAQEFRAQAEGALAEHDLDDATLARAEEGPLRDVAEDKDRLDARVEGARETARGAEAQAMAAAEGALAAEETAARSAFGAERREGQQGVTAEQAATRATEEAGSRTLAERIDAIHAAAERAVTAALEGLQSRAVEGFRSRQAARLEAFAAGVRADLDAFKARRYTGARGLYRRGRDWLLGLNDLPEVRALYERHRQSYIADIDAMIAGIRSEIEATIRQCRDQLSAARTEMETLAETQAGRLDAEARAALTRARGQFARMEERIESSRRTALAALDRERERAISAMDAALAQIRAENEGLVGRIAAALRALAARLGQFMALLARITRMGVGAFLAAAMAQAREGIRNHLWPALQEAFREWLLARLPVLQALLALPPNWLEMLAVLATSMVGLFTENLPALLPAIGAAAMIWLATALALKLIPGAGAIMAVIDGIKAAWGLVQSLFSAASAFLAFVMQVAARANGAVAFARALAAGLVAGLGAILGFLGIDRLIRRVVGAILRPFRRIIERVTARFRAFLNRRRARRGARGEGEGPAHRHARARAERDQADHDRREAARDGRGDRRREGRETEAERRRREARAEERRRTEQLDRAMTTLRPAVGRLLAEGVAGLRLRAQLGIWRLRHGLRKLGVEGSRIVAGNSPDREVHAILHGNAENVYRMVLDIAEARYARAGGGRLSQNPGEMPGHLGHALRERPPEVVPARPGDPGRAQFRGAVPIEVGSSPITAQQGAGRLRTPEGQPNRDVIGNVIMPGGTYPAITQRLEREGLNGPGVAQAVQRTLATGEGSAHVKALVATLFGAEVARRPMAMATAPLALMAMGGGVPHQTMLGTDEAPGTASFAPRGAAPANRDAVASVREGRTLDLGTRRGAAAHAEMVRTVNMVYQVVRQMEFRDTVGLRATILRLMETFDRRSGHLR